MTKRERKNKIPDEIVALGERIKDIINEKGFRTRDVAHDADMDVENLRKYIKGTQEMKVSTLLKITRALGVKIQDLIQDKE